MKKTKRNTEKEIDESTRLSKTQWIMLITLTVSSFLVVLDFASIFIPLPTIMEDLGGTLNQATWVIVAFVLFFTVCLLPSAALVDYFGGRQLFLSGITIFSLASVACGFAPSTEFLIGARTVLGIGAALIEVSVFALIKAVIPEEIQGQALKVQGIAFIAGGLLGTPLSGVITTGLSWEFIFWLNVLVSVVVLPMALRVIPKSDSIQSPRRFDITGVIFSAAGLFFLFFAIIEGTRFGWNSPVILSSFGVAVVLLVLFGVMELRVQDPILDFNLFKNRLFSVGNILRWASEFTSMGIYFAISHYFQVQLGHSALLTGLLLLSVIIGGILVSPVTEPLAKRVDARWLIAPGFLLVAGGTFWLAHVSSETEWIFFLAPLAIVGAGFVAQEDPTINARDRNIPSERSEAAWRISYIVFLLGIGLGVSVVSAVWQSRFMSNMREALGADLPPNVSGKISTLIDGGMSGRPAAEISGSEAIQQLIQVGFADAVNVALISCFIVAIMGAILALFFTSNWKNTPLESTWEK